MKLKINIKDIRVGNYIKDRGNKILKINKIIFSPIQNTYIIEQNNTINNQEVHPLTEYLNNLKPIKLNDIWFKRLGFEKTNIEYVKGNFKWKLYNGKVLFTYGMCGYFETEIMYVHQLQNFYYILTGQELSI